MKVTRKSIKINVDSLRSRFVGDILIRYFGHRTVVHKDRESFFELETEQRRKGKKRGKQKRRNNGENEDIDEDADHN